MRLHEYGWVMVRLQGFVWNEKAIRDIVPICNGTFGINNISWMYYLLIDGEIVLNLKNGPGLIQGTFFKGDSRKFIWDKKNKSIKSIGLDKFIANSLVVHFSRAGKKDKKWNKELKDNMIEWFGPLPVQDKHIEEADT